MIIKTTRSPNKPRRTVTARTATRKSAIFAVEKQALDVVALDLRKISDFTDYFVICTGVVDVHVGAIQKHIEESLRSIGWKPVQVEGQENQRWVLMDYGDFIIHIFQPDARSYYALEKIWGDASVIKIKEIINEI